MSDQDWGDVEHLPPPKPERKPEGLNPLLAGTLEDFDGLELPTWATPKIDGMRALTLTFDQAESVGLRPEPGWESVPVTRNLKPIGNLHVRDMLGRLPPHLDGELWIDGARNFGEVSGPLRRSTGKPAFTFLAFDYRKEPATDYLTRVRQLVRLDSLYLPDWVSLLEPYRIDALEELAAYEEKCLALGFEGVMLRKAGGRYKHGRSTEREGVLLKLKRFADTEAVVVDAVELLENENDQMRSETGYAKRSSAKAGLRPGGMLGALVCRMPADWTDGKVAIKAGIEFNIGSGFTDEQRLDLWARRDELPGELVTFKFQPHGVTDKPRLPIFKGLRCRSDV